MTTASQNKGNLETILLKLGGNRKDAKLLQRVRAGKQQVGGKEQLWSWERIYQKEKIDLS